jgi:uncharacterized protein (DUF2062 family)
MTSFLKKIKTIIQQGTSAKGLALSTTIGILLGVFPILGVSTWLITFIALRFKLNLVLMMSLSYLFWPLQVVLIIPFLRLGEWFWNVPPLPLSLDQIILAFNLSVIDALKDLWDANLYALWGWLIFITPTGLLGYFLLEKLFNFLIKKRKQSIV